MLAERQALRSCSQATATEGLPKVTSIKHIVVLMMENRSFDHMLGYLSKAGMEVDGLTHQSNALRVVRGVTGER